MKRINLHIVFVVLLIACGTVFQNIAMWKTGGSYQGGYGYWGPLARDGVWHEALVGALNQSLPPANPGFAGAKLTNYHYFYDLLVAIFAKALPIKFLIYRLLPITFSILLGVGTYLFAKRIIKKRLGVYFAVYLLYFGSSFGWIIDVIKAREIGGESSFWANQPVSMNINPPFALSLVILVFILIMLDSFLKKPTLKLGLIISVLSGLLVGVKVYAGIILLGGLLALNLKKVFSQKDYSLIPVFVASLFLSVMIFLFTVEGRNLIVLRPLWLIDTMIDAGDRVGIPNFTVRRVSYHAESKWIHLIMLQIAGIVMFIVGNMGTRIVAFVSGGSRYFKKDLNFLILVMILLGILPTLLFIQKGNPWNIVQFLYYFLFLSIFLAGQGLENLKAVFTKKIFLLLIILMAILTPISSIATFRSLLYPNPPSYVSMYEKEALSFLKKQPRGVVMKHPFDRYLRDKYKDPFPIYTYADNAYVAAHTGQVSYLEDVEQQIILDTEYEARLINLRRFFEEKDLFWSNSFLKEEKINYIYLPKVYQLPMAEEQYHMEKIFENDEVRIYKV